ncbi:ABC transporter permease [Paenibacillus sanguinis]|uniref:ABC transporter permease n=1 Tax=Paenibacillus sanguinis TaxID=225906 RepID=UPI00036F7F92|nr:ABC transporter permease [Paenibacillus sanguinis]
MKIIRQTSVYAIVLLIVLLLNFWLPRLLPGGPIDYLSSGGAEGSIFLTEAQKAALQSYYRLEDSLWEQFVSYWTGVFTFDFGLSITYKQPVFDVILVRLPWTLLLVGIATLLSIALGLLLGLLSAWRYPGRSDRMLYLGLLGMGALPEFLLGMALLILLAVYWPIFPLGGAETSFLRPDSVWERWLDVLHHAALPAAALTLVQLASLYLLMRNEAIRVRREPFIEFAEAKGLSARTVLLRHVAGNALLPIVTMIFLRIGGLLAGSVLVETVFAYPGIGKLLQEAILARDYPLLHGLFLIMTIFVLLLNLLADLIYPLLDPRIRVSGSREVVV